MVAYRDPGAPVRLEDVGFRCVALWVAFTLELSEPSWLRRRPRSSVSLCWARSLRKSMFRMIGTVIGAIAIVVLAALFRQDRVSFLVGLAFWCAASASSRRVLTNFAAYAAALAGYTAAIIAIDVLGPVEARTASSSSSPSIVR